MMWNFNEFKDNVAILTEEKKNITYSQMEEMAKELYDQIGERCLVFNLCTNKFASLLGYVSFINFGIVPFLADAGLEQTMLNDLTQAYKPAYLWMPDTMESSFECYQVKYRKHGYVLLQTSFQEQYPLNDELALLLTTSGSTGSPKLVKQSYDNLKANTKAIVQYLELDSTERPITTLPMSYTYGLSIINTHLYVGASIVLTEKTLMQREFWQQFRENHVTSFGGVPYTFEMLEKLRFFRMDTPSLRTMTQAGGKLAPELHKKFAEYAKENNIKFIVMYGQTEATARMAYLPSEKALEKYGSMGIAIPGGEFRLIDIDGNTIEEANVVGELVYKGANVTLGYAQCGEDLIKGDERQGILFTGDMAQRDDDGYYYIVGRKKRFLKIYGSRVNLDETERIIKQEFSEVDCVCAGVDDHLFIFVTDDKYSDEIRKYLAAKLGINQLAFRCITIPKIPRNEAGKILYKELDSYYERED